MIVAANPSLNSSRSACEIIWRASIAFCWTQRFLGSSLLPWVKSLHGNMVGSETKNLGRCLCPIVIGWTHVFLQDKIYLFRVKAKTLYHAYVGYLYHSFHFDETSHKCAYSSLHCTTASGNPFLWFANNSMFVMKFLVFVNNLCLYLSVCKVLFVNTSYNLQRFLSTFLHLRLALVLKSICLAIDSVVAL